MTRDPARSPGNPAGRFPALPAASMPSAGYWALPCLPCSLAAQANPPLRSLQIPLPQQLPLLRGMFADDVPRADLVLAAVTVVDHQLPGFKR